MRILYFRLCTHHVATQRLRVWWYVLHAAMADPKITDAGFVVLINAKDYVLADYLPRFTVGICTSASYFPIKWCAAHLCQCNAAVYSMIATGVRASMSQEQREMFFVHPGSAESVTEALLRDHPFCKECIPCDLGKNPAVFVNMTSLCLVLNIVVQSLARRRIPRGLDRALHQRETGNRTRNGDCPGAVKSVDCVIKWSAR